MIPIVRLELGRVNLKFQSYFRSIDQLEAWFSYERLFLI